MGVLVGLIFTGIARFLTEGAAKMIALKLLLLFIFTTILPIILNNVFYSILENFLSFASNAVSGEGMESPVLELTGLAGYLAQQLSLPDALAIVVSALSFRATLKFLRII